MSVYVIERSIVFDSDVPSLATLAKAEDKTVISATAARCLVMLIDAGGEIVQREQLLHAGWGSLGQVVNENSLNQAITQLRKVLKQLALPGELIMTVPRRGYKISRMFAIKHESEESGTAPIVVASFESPLAGKSLVVIEDRGDKPQKPERKKLARLVSGNVRQWLLVLMLISASYVLFYATNKPVIQQMMTKFHTVNYLPITSKFNELNVFFNDSIEQQGDYLKNAISQFERDSWLHHKIGAEIRYIYINGSYNRDVFSYFLCRDEIQAHPESCHAFTSIQEGN